MSRNLDRNPTYDLALNLSFARGDASDRSPIPNTGTLNGGATVSGGVLVLDGTNDNLSFPDAAALDLPSAFTVSTWCEPSTPGSAARYVAGKYIASGSNRSWLLAWRHDLGGTPFQLVVYSTGGASPAANYLANATLPTSGWHHFAAVWDASASAGTRARFYLDGASVAVSSVASDGAYTPFDTGGVTTVGSGGTGASPVSPWKGNLDDFRLYRRALSAAEIGAIYSGGRQ